MIRTTVTIKTISIFNNDISEVHVINAKYDAKSYKYDWKKYVTENPDGTIHLVCTTIANDLNPKSIKNFIRVDKVMDEGNDCDYLKIYNNDHYYLFQVDVLMVPDKCFYNVGIDGKSSSKIHVIVNDSRGETYDAMMEIEIEVFPDSDELYLINNYINAFHSMKYRYKKNGVV